MATYLSSVCPVVVAPAMDEDMWHHPATQRNLKTIASYGNKIIPVDSGELASGLVGDGRMAEPEAILWFMDEHFFLPKTLAGKKAVVSAGPTYEPIDPVRFVGNHSSGKMGLAIAYELHNRGAEVVLVMGPTQLDISTNGIRLEKVTTAEEMYQACQCHFEQADITVMAAAVADYTPASKAKEKIKKEDGNLVIELTRTRDILKSLGEKKKKGQILIGFALETNNEKEYAKAKLANKNADLIILNSLNDKGAGFGYDTNKITVFDKSGKVKSFDTKSKQDVAKDIVDTLIELYYA